MLEEQDNRWIGNLYSMPSNPNAAQATVRRPGNVEGMVRAQLLGSGIATQGDGRFEAIMTANQSQNRIIADVLDGPVSQQTQRQLAQLQAANQASPPLEELAQSSVVEAEEVAAPKRRVHALMAGSTIVAGLGTGSIFNPSQMTAYRQKYGYQLRMPQNEDSNDNPIVETTRGISSAASVPIKPPSYLRNSSDAELNPDSDSGNYEGDIERSDIDSIIKRVAGALDLDPALIKAVVKTESNYNPQAVSHAGAQGLMQLMPRTAKELGVEDPFDPLQNIWGGAKYLKRMLERHGGNLNKALAAYNWGPGNLDKHGYGNNMPRETRRYIEVVNRNYKNFQSDTAEA